MLDLLYNKSNLIGRLSALKPRKSIFMIHVQVPTAKATGHDNKTLVEQDRGGYRAYTTPRAVLKNGGEKLI